jgi:hypothetical protein
MAYSTVVYVKSVLLIATDEDSYDTELGNCIASADALVDGLLKKVNLTVPVEVPQLIADASAYFAAWLFKDRRGPDAEAAAAKLWEQAHKFLDNYIDTEEVIAFLVGTAEDD